MRDEIRKRLSARIVEVQAEVRIILESANPCTAKYTGIYGYLSDLLCLINDSRPEQYVPICNVSITGASSTMRQTLNFRNLSSTVTMLASDESEWTGLTIHVSFQRDWKNSRFRYGEGSRC